MIKLSLDQPSVYGIYLQEDNNRWRDIVRFWEKYFHESTWPIPNLLFLVCFICSTAGPHLCTFHEDRLYYDQICTRSTFTIWDLLARGQQSMKGYRPLLRHIVPWKYLMCTKFIALVLYYMFSWLPFKFGIEILCVLKQICFMKEAQKLYDYIHESNDTRIRNHTNNIVMRFRGMTVNWMKIYMNM